MIQFPNNRLTYTGKQGPVYDNDGQNAINGLFSAINMLLGLSPTGFAILSGFAVVGNTGGNNIFGPGYFYLNGIVYYSSTITEGQCLVPNITQINNAQFSDGVSRNTYQIYDSTTSNTVTGSTSPLFTYNMDSYRLNLTVLNNLITALQSSVSSLSSGKADKVSGATNNNFAALNGSGDLIDSGDNASSFDAAGTAAGLMTKNTSIYTPVTVAGLTMTVNCSALTLNGNKIINFYATISYTSSIPSVANYIKIGSIAAGFIPSQDIYADVIIANDSNSDGQHLNGMKIQANGDVYMYFESAGESNGNLFTSLTYIL